MSGDYPLNDVAGLRELAVERARQAVARCSTETAERERDVERLEAALRALAATRLAESRHFDERVDRDRVRVAELMLFEERLAGIEVDESSAMSRLDEARRRLESAQRASAEARDHLRDRLAEREALADHRNEWNLARARSTERRETDERDPIVSAQRKPDDA